MLIGVGYRKREGNEAGNAIDGSILARWSAEEYPQVLEIDLGNEYQIDTIEVHGLGNRTYQYVIESAIESDDYDVIVDQAANETGGKGVNRFAPLTARFIRLTVTGAHDYTGDWISLSDIRFFEESSSN